MSANHERKYILSALMLLFSCVIGVLATIPASAQNTVIPVNPDRDIVRAETAMEQGKLDVALNFYKRAVHKNLSSDHKVIVQNSICAVSYLQGEYRAAADACSEVIQKDPRYWKAYVTRGNAKRKLGDFTGALTDFCEANRINPEMVTGAFVSRCTG